MPKGSFDVAGKQRILVSASDGGFYEVFMFGVSPRGCTCPHFEYRAGPRGEDCKHMKARRGRRAVGVTRCLKCPSWLTPEELSAAETLGIPAGSICCSECSGLLQKL